MKWIYFLDKKRHDENAAAFGGKGAALARLALGGFSIPASACLISGVYQEVVKANGISEKIQLVLNRKEFSDMRWEEIWDASLRIRNFFLHAVIPADVESQITRLVEKKFPEKPLAVRSSAPDEDTGHTSFAGLHESYLNIRGNDQVLEHIKKVWASLWSDRALLYRQELGLDVRTSSMAVVIQEMIPGDCSGIVFSRHPEHGSQMIIESVYGLNQGLVDGEIEPDRWILARNKGAMLSFTPPSGMRQAMYDRGNGLHVQKLSENHASGPPLDKKSLELIRHLALKLEKFFGCPQDIEWTMQGGNLYVLQSRPITTLAAGEHKDERSWYLSLHRSFANLVKLRHEIEENHLPAMEAEANRLSDINLEALSDEKLATEIEHRMTINDKWVKVYWADCIPFAHGMRLFGEIYNDVVKPDEPFEFVSLLAGSSMLSKERNDLLAELASMIDGNQQLREKAEQGKLEAVKDPLFLGKLQIIEEKFGNLFGHGLSAKATRKMIFSLVAEYAKKEGRDSSRSESQASEESFFALAADFNLPFPARDILDLGRASYRLRDDDNIYLGKIEQQLSRAVGEARRRKQIRDLDPGHQLDMATIIKILRGEEIFVTDQKKQTKKKQPAKKTGIKARQLIGQPASKGIARGPCRLVEAVEDLAGFKQGEVLVVDAIDPNMTFVAPLAAAIVERRGGMLIHGAIIAREYGIPCVTGVPEAMQLIKTGDTATVDGYLGIVTLGGSRVDDRKG